MELGEAIEWVREATRALIELPRTVLVEGAREPPRELAGNGQLDLLAFGRLVEVGAVKQIPTQ
eukprot:1444252-Prymnesium_polylepis.1